MELYVLHVAGLAQLDTELKPSRMSFKGLFELVLNILLHGIVLVGVLEFSVLRKAM